MKVLQINTVYQNGGSTGRIVYDLRQISEQNDIDSYVAYGDFTGNVMDRKVLQMQGNFRRKWNILKCRIWPRHGFYNVHETKKLIKWMDEVKPDIIHLHNIHNHYVNVKMLFDYIKQHDIPVVWTLHDCWSFTGWCAYFDFAECERWKTQCHDCPCKHDYPFTWFFDLSRSNYRLKRDTFCGVRNLTLVTPSEWLAKLTRESYLKEYPVEVINNGVDLNVFHPVENNNLLDKYGLRGKKIILAMAMALSKRKGVNYLLRLPSVLGDDECLVMVGVPPQLQSGLPQEHCIGIPRTSNTEELAALYSAASVFINPTLEDNFPTTNIEALACGTPVITFRTGGSVESVDENTGLVVDKCDFDALLKAIHTITETGKDKYSKCCVEKAHMLYNKGKQYNEYVELYRRLLNDK